MDMAVQEVTFDEVAAAANGLASTDQPVTLHAVRALLGTPSLSTLHRHLSVWRSQHTHATETPKAELPESLTAALNAWAQQVAVASRVGLQDSLAQADGDVASLIEAHQQLEAERDQALTSVAERETQIERLTIELRHARDIASDALVGKAKDKLAIEGKDAQLADLRSQLERSVAASATESDARLAAEMELVGAVTARDNLAAEVAELRAQLDTARVGSTAP